MALYFIIIIILYENKSRLIENMLDKLGFKKRTHVGIAVSMNNTIELMCIDNKTKSVVNFVTGNIKYNSAIREIIDFEELAEVVENLFEEAGLTPNECAVSLTLPNVCFGLTPLENDSEQGYIVENLQAELEDLYIFKRNDPIISYSLIQDGTSKSAQKILYSAVQSKIVIKLLDIFDNLGIEVERIDTSYSSILRAVKYCDKFTKYNQSEERAAVLLITSNSCCAFNLKGGLVLDYKEQPLAVKSFSPEEVFATITNFVGHITEDFIPQSLLIISETDDVNPELLTERLSFSGEIDYVGLNTNTDDQLISTEMFVGDNDQNILQYMTLEVIGAAAASFEEYSIDINFVPEERLKKNIVQVGGYEIEFIRFILVVLLSAILFGAIFGFVIKSFLTSQTENQSIENQNASEEITAFENRIKKGGGESSANVFPIMQKIINSNKNIVNAYTSLSTEIPDSIYIRKFVTNDSGGIGIIGESTNSEDVEKFLSKLKDKNENLMVAKLSVNTKNDPIPGKIPNGFTFELKTSDADVNLHEDDNVQGVIQNTMSSVQSRSFMPSGMNTTMAPPPAPVI